MKEFKLAFGHAAVFFLLILGLAGSNAVLAAGPAPVNLLSISTNNFVILSKTGITNTGTHGSVITGNIGSSPITSTAMNGVFCSEITGTIYGVDATYVGSGDQTCFAGNPPMENKTLVDNAVLDLGTAYGDAMGRTFPDGIDLGTPVAGGQEIGGMTFTPGLYKWNTNVTISTDVTLSGGANDVWIFQIVGDLGIASGSSVPAGVKVVLIGGAQASNVFWQVSGGTGVTLGTYSTFNGTILSSKQVIIQTGAVLNGRALAQTQVTLDAAVITGSVQDVTPPSAVTNLVTSGATTSSIILTWTAPGDDGSTGTAALYDIRYSTAPIVTDGDFTAAALVSGEPAPTAAGTVQTMTVGGLSSNTAYYFAMKTQDEVPNISSISNLPSLSTMAVADVTPPAAVTNLTLYNPTTSTLDLMWRSPGDDGSVGTATLYDIRYSTSPIVTLADFTSASLVSGEPAPAVAGTMQYMTVGGLSSNTTYYFAMKTQDEVPNISAISTLPSLATMAAADVTPPAAVTNLTPSGATTSSIVLTWTAPGDDGSVGTAALYDIRYSTAPIVTLADFTAAALVSGEPAPTVAGTVQTMTVSGLSAGTTYFFAMKTQDEVPNISIVSNLPSLATVSNPHAPLILVVADVTPPAAVTNLSASGATTSSIVLTWTAPGDDGSTGTAALYDIRYSTAPIVTLADFTAAALVSGEPAPAVAGTVQTMTVGSLAANTAYFFAMKTQDEVPNISSVSNIPSLSTLVAADVTPPAAVTNLSASGATTSSIVLTWTSPGDDGSTGTAALYDIRYSTAPIVTLADFTSAALVSGEPAPAVAGTVQTMTVGSLAANTTYFFAMKTQDEAPNISLVSNLPSLATSATIDVIPPAAVDNMTLYNQTTSSFDLMWRSPGDDGSVGTAALYDIRYSTAPIVTLADFTSASLVSGEPAPVVAGTMQYMTVGGLSANTTYFFAMKTQDEVPNISAISTLPSLATLAAADVTLPSAVTNLAASGATTSSIVLTWTAPGDDGSVGTATLYDIRYSTSPIVTLADFTSASLVLGEPVPSVAGTVQTMTVGSLSANTAYFFAMKTQDEAPNISLVSNSSSLSTLAAADVTLPAAITNLATSGATTSSIVLTWTAPGDDGSVGTAALYDIRYSTVPIVTLADFTAASLVSGEPAPAVAGTVQTMTVGSLAANTAYFFVMKTQDEAPNFSAVSNMANLTTLAIISGGSGGGSYSDITVPVYSSVSATSITSTTATIIWMTDESSDSLVRFGPVSAIGGTALDDTLVVSHSVPISGLTPSTTYHYAICSKDAVGNQSCSGELSFKTLPTGAVLSGQYNVADALASALTINADMGLELPICVTPPCIYGSLIKLQSDNNPATQIDSAVYYFGADGRRHAFSDEKTYLSWYDDFSDISIVSAQTLAAMPLGENVTHRPGSGMIKIQTDPKVYVVSQGGILRWVTTEAIAVALYGANWNTMVSDISDAFFTNYIVGDPVM